LEQDKTSENVYSMHMINQIWTKSTVRKCLLYA